jgi:hypothetical protein
MSDFLNTAEGTMITYVIAIIVTLIVGRLIVDRFKK